MIGGRLASAGCTRFGGVCGVYDVCNEDEALDSRRGRKFVVIDVRLVDVQPEDGPAGGCELLTRGPVGTLADGVVGDLVGDALMAGAGREGAGRDHDESTDDSWRRSVMGRS